jgi:hypothetical protein
MVLMIPTLWAQNPQVPVNGTLGTNGIFPLVNSPSVVFATDADHTMTYPEMSGSGGVLVVTSSVALTSQRNLIAPLQRGFGWFVENSTTGGYAIYIKGPTGTGVTIASGYAIQVMCDGTNYVTSPAGSGGTVFGVTGAAPVASTGGTNPVISMAQATSSVPGYLSAADWSTFNGKQANLGFTPAHSGANGDITSLSGLTTPLSTAQGGTGGAGGTGYAYGNGSAAFSFSPTIPWSAITGGPSAAITTLTGDVAAGPGSGSQAATVQGLKSVPFCTGFTPTNGQQLQYTTSSSPNPCYTAVTPSSPSGVGTMTSYPVSFSLSSSYGGTATVTCLSNACTSIAGYVKLVSSVPCAGCQLEMTSSTAYPSNTYCSSNLIPQVSAIPSGTEWFFSAIGGGVNFSTYVLSSLSTVYISYSCVLQ